MIVKIYLVGYTCMLNKLRIMSYLQWKVHFSLNSEIELYLVFDIFMNGS